MITRRDFLKAGFTAAGSIIAFGPANALAAPNNRREKTRWALLADTHIPEDVTDSYRGFRPCENLENAIPRIVTASPDGVVIAGDLARLEGKPGDYARLKELLAPLAGKAPIYMAPGNHDDRGNLLRVFDKAAGRQNVPGKHVAVADGPPVRVITLDSLMFVNKTPGLLGKAQRQWLKDYLTACDDTPTILCFHHTLADGDGDLLDLPRLFEIVRPIRKVKAIVYGHSHVYGFSKYRGIHLINLPAMGYSFGDAHPVGWVEAVLTARRGIFTLHAVAGNKDNDGSVKKLNWRK